MAAAVAQSGTTLVLPPQAAPSRVDPGGGPSTTSEATGLLQVRLRAAAIFLLVTQAVLLTWRLLVAGEKLWPLHLALLALLCLAALVLSARRDWPARLLRGVELAIFGSAVAFLAVRQHALMVELGRRHDETTLSLMV